MIFYDHYTLFSKNEGCHLLLRLGVRDLFHCDGIHPNARWMIGGRFGDSFVFCYQNKGTHDILLRDETWRIIWGTRRHRLDNGYEAEVRLLLGVMRRRGIEP